MGSGASTTVCGVITQVTTGSYTDANGNSYTADTIVITATDGSSYSYPVSSGSYSVGSLVQAAVTSGGVKITGLSSASLSGKVNSAGTALGNYPLADDIQILDVYEDNAIRIYPARLTGCTIPSSAVRYYSRNAQGEIDRLILKDFTGDMHQYGVITSASEVSEGMTVASSYVYDVGGVSHTTGSSTTVYNVSVGPMVIKTSKGAVDSIKNLSSVALASVDGLTGRTASGAAYPLSEQVAVYELQNGNDYYYSSLDRVSDGSYTLTGYYDKDAAQGGCVRVIIARAK